MTGWSLRIFLPVCHTENSDCHEEEDNVCELISRNHKMNPSRYHSQVPDMHEQLHIDPEFFRGDFWNPFGENFLWKAIDDGVCTPV